MYNLRSCTNQNLLYQYYFETTKYDQKCQYLTKLKTQKPHLPLKHLLVLKAASSTELPTSVKALVDSGIQKIPKFFVWPSEHQATRTPSNQLLQAPVIDLSGNWNQVVEQVLSASETWGIFQVVNHGIPQGVLDGMIEGVREFNEQDEAEKIKYCSKDFNQKVRFQGVYVFPKTGASWKDTLAILLVSEVDPFMYKEQIPPPLRDSSLEYAKEVDNLGNKIFGILSEALGLETDRLKNMECGKGQRMYCHYYPACPEPDVAVGIMKHSDVGFLTILLQNQVNGLQVLHKDQWVDIQPIPGALVINIGDLLQVVSNGKFKSAVHRGTVSSTGPRISTGYFFTGPDVPETSNIYGPIQELIGEDNPPIYKDVPLNEHRANLVSLGPDNYCALDYYKV